MKKGYLLLLLAVLLACSAHSQFLPRQVGDIRDAENVIEFVDGYFAAFGLPSPKDMFQCGNEQDAATIMTFVPQILSLGCQLDKDNLQKLRDVMQEFEHALPASMVPCLDATQSLAQLRNIIGYPVNWVHIDAYVSTHLPAVRTGLCTVSATWTQGNYY